MVSTEEKSQGNGYCYYCKINTFGILNYQREEIEQLYLTSETVLNDSFGSQG